MNGAVAGKLRVVEFAADTPLTAEGNSYYSVPTTAAQLATGTYVRRGMIESSNVNPVTAAVSLMAVQRHAEMLGRALSAFYLRTSLAGRVMAVLPNGVMIVEAERQLTVNNERQTILLRGLFAPGTFPPSNTVLSNAVGDLELELKGKGVLSDGNRPPNPLVRILLRIVGF